MERSGYNSDVSDKQWERLQEYLPELSTRGAHLRKWEPRVIINAISYVVTTGCQWRMLPKDFPPSKSGDSFSLLIILGQFLIICKGFLHLIREKENKGACPFSF